MKIDILTLFPEVFDFIKEYGVIGKALQSGKLDIQTTNIRSFSHDKHLKVDDTVFGGAAGMLMMPGPVVEAIESCQKENVCGEEKGFVIYLSPQGSVLTQEKAISLSKKKHLILLCGHYEGIDSRVSQHFIDEEISIGDYVLTGGEIPAMVLMDTVVRWIDGVLGNQASAPTDSLADGLIQYDEYTKPRDFRGLQVPEVLVSGNHQAIAAWRKESSIENTRRKRPDLYMKYLEKLKREK